jgi:hypothetical protein
MSMYLKKVYATSDWYNTFIRVKLSPSHSHPTFAYGKQFKKLFDWYPGFKPRIQPPHQFIDRMFYGSRWLVTRHNDNWITWGPENTSKKQLHSLGYCDLTSRKPGILQSSGSYTGKDLRIWSTGWGAVWENEQCWLVKFVWLTTT